MKRPSKEFLLQNGKKYECEICGQLPEWNGKPLRLQIDHKNGNNQDNSIENLRFVCPNCHTQTDTFGGRNVDHASRWKDLIVVVPTLPVNFQKYGWVKEVSEALQITPQAVNKWMKKYLPEFYETCYRRKTSKRKMPL